MNILLFFFVLLFFIPLLFTPLFSIFLFEFPYILNQGLNQCILNWQTNSYPLDQQEAWLSWS